MAALNETVQQFVLKGFKHEFGRAAQPAKDDPEWGKLRAAGTRLWLDTGDLEEAAKLWNSSFDALTTNNTLLNKEIQKGIYDQVIPEAARVLQAAEPGMGEGRRVLEIAFILNAWHALRLVERFDAFVSVELHTDLAHDVAATAAYGARYYAICPQRFIVKVPLTPAGFLGARKLVQAGVPINFTLGFSARQNFLAARLTRPAYVNVFMGRLNAFVADHRLGSGRNVGEKATLATQRALRALRQAGRGESALIGASIRNGAQIGALAGCDVLTMPPKAATEYRARPLPQVASRVADDPEIPLAEGVTLAQFNGDSLWSVPAAFEDAVESLLRKDLDGFTPEALQQHFAGAGLGGCVPRWSPADIQTVRVDGKIPRYDRWKPRLASGEIGLDALMNISALQSFAVDQEALDSRIRTVLKGD